MDEHLALAMSLTISTRDWAEDRDMPVGSLAKNNLREQKEKVQRQAEVEALVSIADSLSTIAIKLEEINDSLRRG